VQNTKETATVLLVEDDPSVRRLARGILMRSGHTVLEADGAEMARTLCSQHEGGIDLLLTDVIMPKTNGCQFAEELRVTYPEIKVLFMSGYTDDIVSRHTVLKAGAAFIEKPFTPYALSARVRDVLRSGPPGTE
jgi:DNA-binding response OmpR family regulator